MRFFLKKGILPHLPPLLFFSGRGRRGEVGLYKSFSRLGVLPFCVHVINYLLQKGFSGSIEYIFRDMLALLGLFFFFFFFSKGIVSDWVNEWFFVFGPRVFFSSIRPKSKRPIFFLFLFLQTKKRSHFIGVFGFPYFSSKNLLLGCTYRVVAHVSHMLT